MTIRAVLFDAVGTLIYPHPPVTDVYFDRGRAFGSRLSREKVAGRFRDAFRAQQRSDRPNAAASRTAQLDRHPTDESRERRRWRQIVESVFDDVQNAGCGLFESLWDHFSEPTSWRVFDDVAHVWRQLDKLKLVLGIASNFDERLFNISRSLEPLSTSENVFCSSRIGYPKPSPHFFRVVERMLDLPPDAVLLVGDDWHCDIEGAQAAGWEAVHLDRSLAESSGKSIRSLRDLVHP